MKNPLKLIRAYIRFKRAIRMADEAFAKTGERQYVIPAADGKLMVIDRSNFKQFKKKGYVPRSAHVIDLQLGAFYYTPYKNGKGAMPAKTRKYREKKYYELLNK